MNDFVGKTPIDTLFQKLAYKEKLVPHFYLGLEHLVLLLEKLNIR